MKLHRRGFLGALAGVAAGLAGAKRLLLRETKRPSIAGTIAEPGQGIELTGTTCSRYLKVLGSTHDGGPWVGTHEDGAIYLPDIEQARLYDPSAPEQRAWRERLRLSQKACQ